MNSVVHIVTTLRKLLTLTTGAILFDMLSPHLLHSLSLPSRLLSISFFIPLWLWHLQFSLEYYSSLDLYMADSSFRAQLKVKCHPPPFVKRFDLCKTFYLFTQTFIEFYCYELGTLVGSKGTQMTKTKLFSSRASVEKESQKSNFKDLKIFMVQCRKEL